MHTRTRHVTQEIVGDTNVRYPKNVDEINFRFNQQGT